MKLENNFHHSSLNIIFGYPFFLSVWRSFAVIAVIDSECLGFSYTISFPIHRQFSYIFTKCWHFCLNLQNVLKIIFLERKNITVSVKTFLITFLDFGNFLIEPNIYLYLSFFFYNRWWTEGKCVCLFSCSELNSTNFALFCSKKTTLKLILML